MSTWAVIPAKNLPEAKSRLAPHVPAPEREALARRLLEATVRSALGAPALSGIVVVSASAELRSLATDLGAHACPDPWMDAGDGLNAAVEAGCRFAAERGATTVVVLPADLPLLGPDVIAAFLDEAGDAPVALAPDVAGTGTNALLLRPPLVLAPSFGEGSFARHHAAARARDLEVASVHMPELAGDLDTPDDLSRLCGALAEGAGSHG